MVLLTVSVFAAHIQISSQLYIPGPAVWTVIGEIALVVLTVIVAPLVAALKPILVSVGLDAARR
jgi:hypothetical protein